jgi:tetratricopeptide (TPR) repeat protein
MIGPEARNGVSGPALGFLFLNPLTNDYRPVDRARPIFYFLLLIVSLQSCSTHSLQSSKFSRPLVEPEISVETAERLDRGDHLFLASHYDEANEIYLKALKDQEINPDPSVSAIFLSLYRLATVAEVRKQYDAAIRYYKQADRLLIQEKEDREGELKQIKGYLGALFLAKGMLGETQSGLQKHLALYQRISGGKHPFIGFCQHQLARLAFAKGNRDLAEKLFNQSVVSIEQNIHPDHPYLAVVLDDYARLLLITNRKDEADPLRERSASIRQMYPEKQHTSLYSEAIPVDPS